MKYLKNFVKPIQGFTLIELLVTLAILGVLASLAVPSYRSFLINQQLSSASSDFLVSMLQARSEAIRRGKMVSIFPIDGVNWTTGWYLSEVNNSCAVTGDAFAKNTALGSQVSIKTANTNKSFAGSNPAFTYAATGFPFPTCPSPYYSGSMNGTLAFETIETGRERRVIVSISGRPKLCDPSKETCTLD